MELDTAIKHILDGNGVLIFGAGGSWNARNFYNNSIPTGAELTEILYTECNEDSKGGNLKDAAEVYEEKFKLPRLITELRNIFRVKETKGYHDTIYSQPWIRYYTTNYDEVSVIAAQKKGKTIIPVSLGMDYKTFRQEHNLCLYINGYIGNMNENNFTDEFKLSTTSYLSTENITKSPWKALLDDDLSLAKVIVILGLSLDHDLDLARIIRNKKIYNKIVIIDSPSILPPQARALKRFGTLYDIGIERFASEIENINQTYTPINIESEDYIFSCFNHYIRETYPLESPSMDDITNFYINGNFNEKLVHENLGEYDCIIKRDIIDSILNDIKTGIKLVFIHSKLGNGKTTIIDQLRHYLSREPIHVFQFVESHQAIIHEEISQICKMTSKSVVIIEDYYNYFNILSIFSSFIPQNITFILTARTALYENKYIETSELFSIVENDISTYNVNILTENELHKCRNLFTKLGLFRENNVKTASFKKKILKHKNFGNSEFQSILVDIIKSQNIHKRLLETLTTIRANSEQYYDALLLLLISKILTFKLSIEDILGIIGITNDVPFKKLKDVKEFVSFDDNNDVFRINSAVTARLVIKELGDLKSIINVLVRTVEYATIYSDTDKYSELLRSMISYSGLSSFLGSHKSAKEFFLNYFEHLSKCSYFSCNHFFWLQYAISCTEFKRYERAQIYIDNAYGFAPEKFIPFQINNQQALLLLKIIMDNQSANAIEDFKKAHSLLMLEIKSPKDKEFHVIKLFEFYHDMRNKFTIEAEKHFFTQSCGDAYNRLNRYLRNNPTEKLKYSTLKDNLFSDAFSSI